MSDGPVNSWPASDRAVEAALAGLNSEIHDEGSLQRQQTGEYEDAGSALGTESITVALAADLREQLIAVGRAEERIALGTYGRSVDSGASIPDDRLEAEPWPSAPSRSSGSTSSAGPSSK